MNKKKECSISTISVNQLCLNAKISNTHSKYSSTGDDLIESFNVELDISETDEKQVSVFHQLSKIPK